MDPRNARVCAFASRDVEREVDAEYEGDVISLEEAQERGRVNLYPYVFRE